jgi:hypothetical protein
MTTRTRRVTPLGALVRGLVSGAVGTAVMTACQAALQPGGDGGAAEPADDEARWRQAPVPARVARRVLVGVYERDVPPSRIPLLANATHWLYGTSLGTVYGLVRGTVRAHPVVHGLAFGLGAWSLSYAQLVPMGLYEPPWKYPPKELAKDVSYHLAYGLGVAGAFEALDRRS